MTKGVNILRKTFLSLRNRNFKLYFIGQIISNSGNWLTNIAVTLLVLKLSKSGLALGLLAVFQYGPILFLSIWAGALADRADKRKMLILTQSLEMLQSFGLAVLGFLPNPSLISLYLLSLVGGVLLAFDNPLRRSFISEMVPPEDIPNAVVLHSAIVNISRIFGPALAGLLVVTMGFGWCFTIDALSYLVVIYCLYIMRPKDLYRHPAKPGAGLEIGEGLRYVASMPLLWINFVMLLAIGLLSYNFSVTLPLFVTDSLNQSGSVFTILFSIFSLGALICALFIARRKIVQMRDVLIGAASLGLSMLFLSVSPDVIVASAAVFLIGMSYIIYITANTAIIQVEARPGMHGRVMALQTVLIIGTTPIGGPILGWLADIMGGRAPLVLGGIVSLLAAAFGFWANRHYISNTSAAAKKLVS